MLRTGGAAGEVGASDGTEESLRKSVKTVATLNSILRNDDTQMR